MHFLWGHTQAGAAVARASAVVEVLVQRVVKVDSSGNMPDSCETDTHEGDACREGNGKAVEAACDQSDSWDFEDGEGWRDECHEEVVALGAGWLMASHMAAYNSCGAAEKPVRAQ